MDKSFNRIDRIAESMQRELSKLIQYELKDPRLGMVTVTHVKVTRDLAFAKVYVTILGDEESRQLHLDLLHKAQGFLRHQLGQLIKLRKIPELIFVYDESLERANYLQGLIDKALDEDNKNK